MQAIPSSNRDIVAKLVPGGVPSLAHLSSDELLANTRRLVGKSNQLFAELLLHLAEVETRGIHRKRLCASLYTYCIYELRFSEDAAARRSSAARLVRQFPVLFDAIANGELHLTGLLMLGPHLTPENHLEVLGRAKFRTKKELTRLLRELNPLPQVPDLVQPVRPELKLATRNPSWEVYAASLGPAVRELPLGERPRDWASDGTPSLESEGVKDVESTAEKPATAEQLPVGRVPLNLAPITGPLQYQMQFTTSEEHARLVERAKALLARTRPGASLGELHFQAMKLLVASLEKQKFAITDRPRKTPHPQPREAVDDKTERQSNEAQPVSNQGPRRRGDATRDADTEAPRRRVDGASRRSRHIPAAEKRAVFLRDGGRCTYVDASGERCCEEHFLELHHVWAFAKGGASVAENLTLRCAAHNALAAEEDFGREVIAQRRNATRHESLASQADAIAGGDVSREPSGSSFTDAHAEGKGPR